MYQIKKRFVGYPFAHRQHTHEGHCKLIHGHNWDFEIHLASPDLDEHGFVYDFGKFGWLKDWLKANFDHTFVISEDDPLKKEFVKMHVDGLCDLVIVDSCSAEGLAKYVYERIHEEIGDEMMVVAVTVYEDHKNQATYSK